MADPPADGFDFMCEPSGGSLIQLTASVRPREMLASSQGFGVFFSYVLPFHTTSPVLV